MIEHLFSGNAEQCAVPKLVMVLHNSVFGSSIELSLTVGLLRSGHNLRV